MVKSKQIRCGTYFSNYAKELAKRGGMSNANVTDNLAKFLEEEQLTPLLLRRAEQHKKRKERGLFN